MQAVASLSSGWFLFQWGWQGVLFASLPLVLAAQLIKVQLRAELSQCVA